MKKIAIILSGLAFLISCQDPSYPTPVPSSTVRSATVALINAAPDYPSPASFLINNASAASISFPGASLAPVTAGAEQFRIKNAVFGIVGSDTVSQKADLVLYTSATAIQGNGHYTYIITDTVNNPHGKGSSFTKSPGGVTLTAVTDVVTAPASGNAGIRFFNLAPGAPAVYLTHDGGQTFSGLTASFAYKKTTGTFTAIPTGNYSIEVNTGSPNGPTTIPSMAFADGKLYTIFLTGKVVKGVVKVSYAVSTVQHN